MKRTFLLVVAAILFYSCSDNISVEPECIEYVPIEIDSVETIPVELNVIEAAHGWITRPYPIVQDPAEIVATLIDYELHNYSSNDVIYDGFRAEMLDFSCQEIININLEEIIEPHSVYHSRMYLGLRCQDFSESDGDSTHVVFSVRCRYCISYRTVPNGCDEILVVPFTIVDTVMAEVRVDLRPLP